MKKLLKIILVFLLLLILGAAITWFGFLKPKPLSISLEDRAQIYLMPLPTELVLGNGQFELESDLGHIFNNSSTPRLKSAIKRFYSKLSSHTGIPFKGGDITKLILDCKNTGNEYPSIKDDESYNLSVTSENITISANSETGILHGLESLLQLPKEMDGKWVLPELKLKDEPRYPWRGLMIDVGRHWIPKDVILRNLDAMATLKMNVFHWHLTDYQGFRIESKLYPKLHKMGSEGNYYTQEDIKEVVNYASERGIRVVPEFDVPGHTTSWFVGHPELASFPVPYVLDTVFGILDPVMDPTEEKVYNFLDRFFGEMAALFPDEYIHIGGDEVNPIHWNRNASIQKFMDEQGIGGHYELQTYFNIRLQKILEKYDKQMMGWDEIIHPNLPKKNIVVQSWRNQKSLWDAAKGGNKAVLSNGYYLDYKQPAGVHYKVDPLVISGAITIDIDSMNWKGWETTLNARGTELKGSLYLFGEGENLRGIMNFMENISSFTDAVIEGNSLSFSHETPFGKINYNLIGERDSLKGNANISIITADFKAKRIGGTDMPNGEPLPKFEKIIPLTPEQEVFILGGETCMWSEMVDSITMESRIWPRAAAVAEKLWSSKELTTDIGDMYRRIMIMDDRLEELGLKHRASSETLIHNMVEKPYYDPLRTLVNVLQEDKFFNRMVIYDPELYTSTPLNRVVDAARPESYIAYNFTNDVESWIENEDNEAKARITQKLIIWAENHTKLSPAFDKTERLKEIELHSINLSELSKLALDFLNDRTDTKNQAQEIDSLLISANQPHGGTILSVVDGMRNLLK